MPGRDQYRRLSPPEASGKRSPRLRVAIEHPDTNPNALLPNGPGSFERPSSQADMTGIPVTVRPA